MSALSFFRFWFGIGFAQSCTLYIHNDSTSKQATTTSTSTESQSSSQVVDSGAALNISRSSTGAITINNTQTDHGAVDDAFNFANSLAQGAASEQAASSASIQAIATQSMDAVRNAYADESNTLADAYTTAKAGEQKVMVAAALAIVGLVAIKSLGKH